MTFKTHGP